MAQNFTEFSRHVCCEKGEQLLDEDLRAVFSLTFSEPKVNLSTIFHWKLIVCVLFMLGNFKICDIIRSFVSRVARLASKCPIPEIWLYLKWFGMTKYRLACTSEFGGFLAFFIGVGREKCCLAFFKNPSVLSLKIYSICRSYMICFAKLTYLVYVNLESLILSL